jgi:hypothetical protein
MPPSIPEANLGLKVAISVPLETSFVLQLRVCPGQPGRPEAVLASDASWVRLRRGT